MDLSTTFKHIYQSDPISYEIVKNIEELEGEGGDFVVYYQFPIYREGLDLVASPLIIVTPYGEVFIVATKDGGYRITGEDLVQLDGKLDQIFNLIFSKLVKVRDLRKKKGILKVGMEPVIYAPDFDKSCLSEDAVESEVFSSIEELTHLLSRKSAEDNESFSENVNNIRAVLEGSRNLLVPKSRDTEGYDENQKIIKLAKIESGIGLFDRDQRHGYMSVLSGPQRIRGLAGCGKTVVLAMKAALMHLREPEAKICFTFHTKSLYQHVKSVITKFYRQYDDKDPDWDNLKIMHAWGGKNSAGVYFNACRSHGHYPLSFPEAVERNRENPFAYACRELLESSVIRPEYDYIFVDEAQDFSEDFLGLCMVLARHEKMVWGADELQNIFQTKTVPLEDVKNSLVGENYREVDLEEDVVLHKCYRTPLEILVVAHALGFGLYGKIVQMLENREHWEDLGYKVVFAEYEDDEEVSFKKGSRLKIERPQESSPSFLDVKESIDSIICSFSFDSVDGEVNYVSESLVHQIEEEGLLPEDILVICLDDRHARKYFARLEKILDSKGVLVNDKLQDRYSVRDFCEEGRVTLSTVHKAKGNEAYQVYVIGSDACFVNPSARDRNKVFTAFTRAKGWIEVTGVGEGAKELTREVDEAKSNCPYLVFDFPTDDQIRVMRRDLTEKTTLEAQELDNLRGRLDKSEYKKILEEELNKIGGNSDNSGKKF